MNRSKALNREDFVLFLGGVKTAGLKTAVTDKMTMAEFGRRLGVTYVGYMIEYRLGAVEDLKIMSLMVRPAVEARYNCRCVIEAKKSPVHLIHKRSEEALHFLTAICPCNDGLNRYFK